MAQSSPTRALSPIVNVLLPNTCLAQSPKKPQNAALTAEIADMHLHPTLEALLHILNHDLASAHFLVRHMQAPPAVEGMLLHGMLHRAEGDFGNARAWVSDVGDICSGYQPKQREAGERLEQHVAEQIKGGDGIEESLLDFIYGAEDPKSLINDVQAFRHRKAKERSVGVEKALEARIRLESERIMEWCKNKFGDMEWNDATTAWVKNSDEISKMSRDMVSGGKGFRDF